MQWQTEELNESYDLETHAHHRTQRSKKSRQKKESSAGVNEWHDRDVKGQDSPLKILPLCAKVEVGRA